jgi:hypothetical protein
MQHAFGVTTYRLVCRFFLFGDSWTLGGSAIVEADEAEADAAEVGVEAEAGAEGEADRPDEEDTLRHSEEVTDAKSTQSSY